MEVTDQCHFDQVFFVFRNHGFVLLVDDIIGRGFRWFVLEQVLHPVIKIYFLPFARVAVFENEGAERVLIEDLILEQR
jgi:hypothetical protein